MSCISHITERAVVAAAATDTAARARDLVENVVLVVPDRLRREKMGKLVATRVLISPLLHCPKHVSLNFDMVVASSRMMECAKDIVNNLVYRNTGVLPGIKDTARSVS